MPRRSSISIHAPTWGATLSAQFRSGGQGISIHAPTWGATYGQHVCNSTAIFQSTHPRGVRRRPTLSRIRRTGFQSTHPRGVRPKRRTQPSIYLHFNPRTHVGCDGASAAIISGANLFQSTHPRGVRLKADDIRGIVGYISIHAPTWGATWLLWCNRKMCPYFNPRTHVGCDRI